MKLTNKPTGFSWGPACVTRLMSDEKHGVWLCVSGLKQRIDIRVTNSGRLRVFDVKKVLKNEADLFGPNHS